VTTPIIIETPAPPTRERLVLVPPETVSIVRENGTVIGLSIRAACGRDATPDDLARAGYEQLGPEVLRVSAAEWRAMKLRAEGREAHGEPGTLAHLRNDLRDAEKRAERAERERDEARSEVARLTAPAEGEPTDEALRDAFEVAYRDAASECHANAIRAIYRLGVAHERARQQPAQDRATDEELERAYSAAYARAWESEVSTPDRGERAGVLAVAARVRQERCLVAQAVDAHMSMHVYRRGHDGWAVALGPRFVECERADVPATLARLLGEVERG